MLQIIFYPAFILIAAVIVPIVARPTPPPQAGSSKDSSHPIVNPTSNNRPLSEPSPPPADFFFPIEGANTYGGHTDGGHTDGGHNSEMLSFHTSDPQTVARYTVQPGPPTQSWNQNLNENSRPSTPIKPSLSQQIPSRGSSLFRTSPASSGPHSPLHDQHPDPRQPESPQDTGSHSPIPLEYDRKGKRKARDSDSEGQNPEPATKKRKGDSTKARSFPASSSSNRNRRNDMGAAKRKRALKLEAAKSQSPKPEPTIDSILDRENLFCNRPPCVNKPVGGKGRKSNMDQHVNVNHPTHPDAKLPENNPSTCDKCLQVLKNKRGLAQHKRVSCKGMIPEDC